MKKTRKMNKKTRILTCFLLIFVFLAAFSGSNVVYQASAQITSAKSMCVLESTSNRILYSKNEKQMG